MEIDRNLVCVLIPMLNEEKTIGNIIKSFQNQGYQHIFVVDGNSTDDSVNVCLSMGIIPHIQKGKGKGNALKEAFSLITEPYILLLDADGTNPPECADKMVSPLFEQTAEHVIGNRLNNYEKGALTKLNYFGNIIMNRVFQIVHGKYLGDILSGYRAFTKKSIGEMKLKETGFGIETEISAQIVKNNVQYKIIPTYYKKRTGSPTKLNPFLDGWKIILAIIRTKIAP